MFKSIMLAALLTILAPPTIAHNGGAPSMPILYGVTAAEHPCMMVALDEVVVTIEKAEPKVKVKTKVKSKQKKKKVWKAPTKKDPKLTGHPKSIAPDTHKSERPLGSHDSKIPLTKLSSHAPSHLTTGPPCG